MRGAAVVAGCAASCVLAINCVYDYSALSGHGDGGLPVGGGTGGDGALAGVAGNTLDDMIPMGGGGGGGSQAGGGGQPVEVTDGAAGAGGGTGGLAAATGGGGGSGGMGPTGLGGSSSVGAGGGTGGGTGGASPGGGGGSAGGSSGVGSGGAGGSAAGDPDLVLWYKFDESTGTTAADSSGAPGGPRNATLAVMGTGGAVGFSATHQVGTHSIGLTGNSTTGGGAVLLPSVYTLAPGAITVAAWVYETSDLAWQRVFDIGTGATVQMFLATRENKDANNSVRFVITTTGGTNEQFIQSSQAISLNAWHHVAVTLQNGSPYTGTLYVDGAVAGINAAMTLHASDLGVTTLNYIGKSQYATDPYLTGNIDDFRVYQRALTATEIAALYASR